MFGVISFINVFILMTFGGLSAKVKALRSNLSQFTEPGIISKSPLISAAYYYVNGILLYYYRIEGNIDVYIFGDRILIFVKDWLLFMDKNDQVKILSKKAIYKKWDNMLNRCYRSSSSSSKNYMLRGIKVCEEWKYDSKKFMIWAVMFGAYFEGSVIDRINNNKNYEPGNVRFVTTLSSLNNKRNSLRLTVEDEELTIAEWSRRTDISYGALHDLYLRDPKATADLIRDVLYG
ncbi:hypothetical protein SAMN02910317_01192 [Ruminococcaceae bacterium FB2012]|nr:hypothetical protein SAMN02910317_01192 [Ruminococcaceae bacterium FB2012]